MAGLAFNPSTFLRPRRVPSERPRSRWKDSRIVACSGTPDPSPKLAVANSDTRLENQEIGEGIEEKSGGDGDRSAPTAEDGKLEQRGPSVAEAMIQARRQGQEMEAFSAPYRTKRWALTRNKGAKIADLMLMYGGLLDRGFGTGQIMAASGMVVIAKVRKDANKLRGQEDVRDELVEDLLRAIDLLEKELKLLKTAGEGEALFKRLEDAKKPCKLAFQIANKI